MKKKRVWAGLMALAALGSSSRADDVIYVPRGAAWKYFMGLSEASSPDTSAWCQPDFDDSAWSSGPAPFGFGDGGLGTDLALLDPPMLDHYRCLFLRKSFEVPDPRKIARFYIRATWDDGFVLWVNGLEVHRSGVGDPLTFDHPDFTCVESAPYEAYEIPVDPDLFAVAGTNWVAVQAFNCRLGSSDFKVDVELFDPFGPDLTPPAVQSITPSPGITVRSLTQIEVTFTEEVAGVSAADLLVEGLPAQGSSGTGRGPYIFTFAQPSPGPVSVAWAADTGITDMASPSNPFAGGSWTYALDPSAPAADLAITEFLAANRSGLRDADGETSDWIEIQNKAATSIDLGGWALTDERDDPGKWTFPAVDLGPGQRLVVFASGKDRRPAGGGELHTNFQLNSGGEHLGLYTPDSPRRAVSGLPAQFPEQRPDISYGLTASGAYGHLDPPTPGADNGTSEVLSGVVADPTIHPPRGFYAEPLSVEIFTSTPGAVIYYTLGWQDPTPSSATAYAAPFQVSGSDSRAVVIVRAAAYKSGYLPSRIVTQTFIYPAHVLRQPSRPQGFPTSWGSAPAVDYEMDPEIVNHAAYKLRVAEGLLALPSLSIVMDVNQMFGPSGIYSNPIQEGAAWERPASVELVDPSGRSGFQVDCGIRIQGGASREPPKSPKHSLRLLFKGDYGPTRLGYRFFPDSQVDSFDTITLRANYNNSWIHWDGAQRLRGQLIHDEWARDTQLAMGRLSSHGTFMHVYISGLYWGVYNAVERPNAAFAASYLGGEKEDYDALNAGAVTDGNLVAWNTMIGLAGAGLADLAKYEAIQGYLDVPGFIDYMILNIYGGNDDWPHHNWYAVRRREVGALFRFVSWDAERILEGQTVNKTGVNDANSPGALYAQLRANAEFKLLFADHIQRHFSSGGALTPQAAADRWSFHAAELDDAIVCESARWGDYRRDVHPSSNGPYYLYTRNDHWIVERDRLLGQYFPSRSQTVLGQFKAIGLYPSVGAPLFSQHGGTIDPGFRLEISLPAGTTGDIHYTLDGSDPRAYGTGKPSPSASIYEGSFVLPDTTVVKARTRSGTTWSALAEAVFSVLDPAEALRVTEIMYHPPGGSTHEFLELHNASSHAINLGGLIFTAGITYEFPGGTVLGAGEYFVLASDPPSFASLYPGVAADGAYFGSLDNSGERLTIKDSRDRTILTVEYDDDGFWPMGPDGFGYSLVPWSLTGDLDDPRGWRASSLPKGSPAMADAEPADGGVIIHEILTRAAPPLEDAIELFNMTDQVVDLGGWYLSDSREDEASLKKYRIPDGTVIPALGFAVLYEGQFHASPGAWPGFELGAAGGGVYLASAAAGGALTGHVVGHRFEAAEPGVSFGAHAASTRLEFTALLARSFGADEPSTVEEFRSGGGLPNAMPRVGPVVIHEIQYHPSPLDVEFVELHNISGEAVSLAGWRLNGVRNLDGTDDYELPEGSEVAAGGFLLLVPVDPESFRSRYSVSAEVPIAGPTTGALDNAGERLELLEPAGLAGAFIVVDSVRYNDREPWPPGGDGTGKSIERIRASEYGNDPANWAASSESPGTPGRANSASQSSVNQRPLASFAAAPQAGTLNVLLDASGSRDLDGLIVRHFWNFGDATTGQGKTVTHVYSAPGTYTVTLTVEDDDGATGVASRSVTLSGTAGGWQMPGDANQDGALDISDPITLLMRLFLGLDRPFPCDGNSFADGGNKTLHDLNQDGTVNLTDPIHGLNYLFMSGPAPILGTSCRRIPGCPDVCEP